MKEKRRKEKGEKKIENEIGKEQMLIKEETRKRTQKQKEKKREIKLK